MGGEDMFILHILIGFWIAVALLSAYDIVKILYTNRTVRRELERIKQERTESDNHYSSVHD